MLMKLIRLGWTVELYRSATTKSLLIELSDPQTLVDERLPYRLDTEANVDLLPGFEVEAAIEETIRRFCLRNGL